MESRLRLREQLRDMSSGLKELVCQVKYAEAQPDQKGKGNADQSASMSVAPMPQLHHATL